MKRFGSIDGMKVIAAFLVICIHISFPGILGEFVIILARIAVPFFFILSGFFLWSDNQEKFKSRLQNSIPKILKIIVFSNLVYLVWNLVRLVITNHSIADYFNYVFSIEKFYDFIIFNDSPFAIHLWYLSAYLYVLLLSLLLLNNNWYRKAFRTIPLLLVIGLVFGKYSLLFFGQDFPLIFTRNFLFVGLPYFFIGNIIREKYEADELPFTKGKLRFSVLFFSVTSLIEGYVLGLDGIASIGDYYISTTLLIIAIFLYLLQDWNLFKGKSIEKVGELYTLNIYIIHIIYVDFLNDILPLVSSPNLSLLLSYLAPILVFIASYLTSKLIIKINDRISYSPLN